ncbi:hypothetical protein [Poseidonocella sp. HB161398]|uniref:hypothetical protein n=1 Tax=Poseidonocella sp. HB161398 TaxID=2320855 RepID=UPI003512C89E
MERGEIHGFLGWNGCGTTGTMKMPTGLLEPGEGGTRLFGKFDPADMEARRRAGFMTPAFPLYSMLSKRQNLELQARLFGIAEAGIARGWRRWRRADGDSRWRWRSR